jgi:4-amino-4-deoxy-L-arabinose transferase-like glycosyltransferase
VLLIWVVVSVGLLLRVGLAWILPPGYDEAYYLFYGKNLDLSYFDHPVAVGIWSWLGQSLGLGLFGLRLPSVLSYTAATLVLADATHRWYGRGARLWVVVLATACPLVFVCGGILLLPDSPLLLVLSLFLWWLSRHGTLTPSRFGEAVQFALLAALLTLSKYHAFLLLPSILGLSLGRADGRQAWKAPWPYLSVLIWALLTAPLWLWNLNYDWVSFLFQGGRTGAAPGLQLDGSALFLISQIGLLFPVIGLLLMAMLWPTSCRGIANREATSLLRWLAWPQLLVFAALAARMQVMASWLVPAWWITLPIAAAWLATKGWRSWRVRRGVLITSCVLPPLLLLAGAQMRWGVLNSFLPASQDPSSQLMHPDDLRSALRSDPKLWDLIQKADIIASHRYEIPGFLALALPDHPSGRFTTLNSDARGFAFWPSFRSDRGSRGLLIAPLEPGSLLAQREFPAPIHSVQPLGTVLVRRSGVPTVELEIASFEADPGRYPWPYGAPN